VIRAAGSKVWIMLFKAVGIIVTPVECQWYVNQVRYVDVYQSGQEHKLLVLSLFMMHDTGWPNMRRVCYIHNLVFPCQYVHTYLLFPLLTLKPVLVRQAQEWQLRM